MSSFFSVSSLFYFFFFLSFSLNGQDLIERTRNDIKLLNTSPNTIAKNIALEKKHNTFTAVSFFKTNSQKYRQDLKNYLKDIVYLDLDKHALRAAFKTPKNNISLQIPVTPTKQFELELSRVEILTPDFVLRTSDGQALTYDDIPVLFYRGIIKGNLNSTATFTFHEDEVKGLITDRDGNYVIAPSSENPQKYILYNDKNLIKENTFQCDTDDNYELMGDNLVHQVETEKQSSNCIEVYIECDYAMYQSHNFSLFNVIAFANNLFAEVSTLYANESITISLSEVFVWGSPDPYINLNSTLAVLSKFGETRQNDYNGRLAHLLSTRNLGGGIAWIDVLCANHSTFTGDLDGDGTTELYHAGPYAFSAGLSTNVTPVPTYSWNVEVFAHEMGHNLGSRHTHDCVWGPDNNMALDNCSQTVGGCPPGPTPTNGGTIMSYCHLTNTNINFNNGFGQEPGDLIRGKYNNASCTLTCNDTPPSNLNIEGLIVTSDNSPMNTVETNLTEGNNLSIIFSNNNGYFQHTDLVNNLNYTLSVEKDVNSANGVTISDIVQTKAHVLEIVNFQSPYQIIAADVNNSGSLSIGDVLLMKAIANNFISEFPSVPSWRFVPSDYNFPNPTNPFPFPETRIYYNLNENFTNQNFIGIKMGDVNGSANPNQ